jgi:hypothetical protein
LITVGLIKKTKDLTTTTINARLPGETQMTNSTENKGIVLGDICKGIMVSDICKGIMISDVCKGIMVSDVRKGIMLGD